MSHEIKQVGLDRIYLDNDNPRHDPIDSEHEIIGHLLKRENIKAIARHIAESKSLSPLERIAVVAHPKVPGAFVAVEGNRRICALKLLSDPDKARHAADRSYFQGLADKMVTVPHTLEVVIFSDKTTARPWISLRHEGEQGGIGTKPWNPGQKARFNTQGSDRRNPDIQSLLLKEYAAKKAFLESDQISAVSLTTLTRYLTNPVFRAALGLEDNRTLSISVPEDEFDRAIKRFLSDTLDRDSGVNSRTNADQRKAYAEKLRAEGIAPLTRGLPLFDISIGPRPTTVKPAKTSRNNRNPDDRKHVIPKTFTAHISDKVLKRLYDELRTLEAETFSFAATYLLRAVIEQAATLYLRQQGHSVPGELHVKLDRVAKALDAVGMTDRDLKVLRTMSSDKDSRYSPDTIGHFIHGGAVPTHTHAIRLWDSIEPVMKTILGQLK